MENIENAIKQELLKSKTTLLRFPESDFEMLTHLTVSLGNIAQHLNNRRRDYAESESVKMIALLVRFIERK